MATEVVESGWWGGGAGGTHELLPKSDRWREGKRVARTHRRLDARHEGRTRSLGELVIVNNTDEDDDDAGRLRRCSSSSSSSSSSCFTPPGLRKSTKAADAAAAAATFTDQSGCLVVIARAGFKNDPNR